MLSGMIILWSGSVASIPNGFRLCDGNNGTPDLRDKFVVGAGSTYDPGDTGGSVDHLHTLDSQSHSHDMEAGSDIQAGIGYSNITSVEIVTGTTNTEDNVPPFYALAYIMKT